MVKESDLTNLIDFLGRFREPCPDWLRNFAPEDDFDLSSFFNSRIVFYPGALSDGHPIRLFGSAHAAHCFVYADYLMKRESIIRDLDSPLRSCRGYRTYFRQDLSIRHVFPADWIPSRHHAGKNSDRFDPVWPYAFIELLERKPGFGDQHGAERLALLYLGVDGYAIYDALFCWKRRPPFAMLLEDHGFMGGNYDRFGAGGLMERLAFDSDSLPSMMVVGQYTTPWEGYRKVPDVAPDPGGMHHNNRFLYVQP